MAALFLEPNLKWLLPVVGGILTQGYGPENTDPEVKHLYAQGYHPGVDFAGVPEGSDVLAQAAGEVVIAGTFEGKGNTVGIRRSDGLLVINGHLSRIDVAMGQHLNRGDVIGGIGKTGVATGVHLHLEYRRDGKDIDPVPFLLASANDPAAAGTANTGGTASGNGTATAAGTGTATVTLAPAGVRAVVREDLNLRAGPGTNEKIILTAKAGTAVVIGQDGWVPVVVNGQDGWMFAKYLDVPAQP